MHFDWYDPPKPERLAEAERLGAAKGVAKLRCRVDAESVIDRRHNIGGRHRIERGQAVPVNEPARDRLAQCGRTGRRGIIRERARARVQRVDDEADEEDVA